MAGVDDPGHGKNVPGMPHAPSTLVLIPDSNCSITPMTGFAVFPSVSVNGKLTNVFPNIDPEPFRVMTLPIYLDQRQKTSKRRSAAQPRTILT
jgi:hypothetical protein